MSRILAYTNTESGQWQAAPCDVFTIAEYPESNFFENHFKDKVTAIATDDGRVYDFIINEWRNLTPFTSIPTREEALNQMAIRANTEPLKADSIDKTLTERGNRYGPFSGHALITQQLKEVMQCNKGWSNLSRSQKESLEMIAHKIGRILNGDPSYIDSWHDIAGYATLVEKQLEGKDI